LAKRSRQVERDRANNRLRSPVSSAYQPQPTGKASTKRLLTVLAILLAVIVAAPAAEAESDVRVAIHIDENGPQKMNILLNIAQNVGKYYAEQGKTVEIAIVAHGPGLTMFRADKSPVKDRIEVIEMASPSVHLEACGNTITGLT